MTDFQILCFLQAAACQNFTRAAELLGITQPALSREIAALEKGLGLVLFKRTKSGTLLTAEGRVMYSAFQESSQRIQTGIERAAAIRDRNLHLITIGCPQDWRIDGFVQQMINQCKKVDPLIQIEILQLGSHDLYESLEDGSLDLTFDCVQPDIPGEDYTITEIRRIHTYLLYPEKSGPAENPAVFQGSTFILISQNADIQGQCKAIQACTGFAPRNTITVNSAEAQYLSVRCGLGVAMINEISRNAGQKDARYLALDLTVPILAITKLTRGDSIIQKILKVWEITPI